MGKAIFLAVTGLILSLAAPILARADDDTAKDNRCLAQPYVVIDDGNYEYSDLSQFLGNFTIVEKAEEDSELYEKRFEIINLKHRDVWIWEVECSFVPSKARITQQTDNYLRKAGKARTSREYEIWLASFRVNFNYSGPAVKSVSNGQIAARPMVNLFVKIKTDNLGTSTALNDDQLELLVDSIKTQRPVRLKGRMYINFSADSVTELQNKLENEGVMFAILEINGQSVPEPY